MGHVGLDYARFFPGDLGDRPAQNLNVIKAYVGTDRQDRMKDIGRVESASQAHLDYRYINMLRMKVFEGESRDYFEKGEFFFTRIDRLRST